MPMDRGKIGLDWQMMIKIIKELNEKGPFGKKDQKSI